MKNILTYLQKLGFSETEAKLYIILLKSKPLTVAQLAEKSKINRTASYSHINALLEKGIIIKVKGSANKIAANPPDHLYYLVEQKAIQISTLQEKLPSVISALNTTLPQANIPSQSEIKYYKGKAGVKMIYSECFKTNILRSYFNADDTYKIFPENIQTFQKAFIKNSQIRMFEILEVSKRAVERMHAYDDVFRHSYKFLPKDVKLTANDILLYNGKVAIINIGDRENVTGVVLENRDYYNNSVQLFDLLWRLLPEPEV